MRFGFDDNLGLPEGVAELDGCETVSYHDLSEMLGAFEHAQLDAMFTPAGTLPYIEPGFDIVAQATRGEQRAQTLTSIFLVPDGASDTSETELATVPIGCVNRYCTTSFWAPMLTLMEVLPAGTALDFRDTTGFQDLLSSTLDDRGFGAMVWNVILDGRDDWAPSTEEVFRRSGMPTPVVLVRAGAEPGAARALRGLCGTPARRTPGAPSGFFNGLAEPDHPNLAAFAEKMSAAQAHFGVGGS